MADSYTGNLNLRMPEVGAAADSWGGPAGLNGDLELIDAVFLATGLGTSVGLHVGTGKILNVEGSMQIADSTDTTKRAVLLAASIATATTRTYSFPDASGTLALVPAGVQSVEAVLAATASLSTSYVAKVTLPSVGLAGEVWQVSGYATVTNTTSDATLYAQIYDGTAGIAASNIVTAAATYAGLITVSRIVTLTGPTIFSLRGKCDRAGGQFLGGAVTSDNFTAINAIRLS